MKKIRLFSLILALLMTVSMLGVSSFAELTVNREAFNTVVGTPSANGLGLVVANNNAPGIDGSISDSEGWSQGYVINDGNINQHFWGTASACIISGTVRFAWDSANLYLAADIQDPCYIKSTGDGTDVDDGDAYFNGDIFIFTLDPLAACFNSGMTQSDYNTWYYISNHDDVFECKSTVPGSGTYSDTDVKGAVAVTDSGWAFECAIPWETIVADTESASLSSTGSEVVEVAAADVAVQDTVSDCCILYMDRATFGGDYSQLSDDQTLDEGTVFTAGKLATTPVTLRDGMAPSSYSDVYIKSYGIRLALGDASGNTSVTPDNIAEEIVPETEETTTAATTEPEDTEEETTRKQYETKGSVTGDNSSDDEEDSSETTRQGGGGNTGLIIGIIAAAVVAIAAVVFVIIKKKKAQ